jgi:hypothetical protein
VVNPLAEVFSPTEVSAKTAPPADMTLTWQEAKAILEPLLSGGDGAYPGENTAAPLPVDSFYKLDPDMLREDLEDACSVATVADIVQRLQVEIERLDILGRALEHAGGSGPEVDRGRLESYTSSVATAAQIAFQATMKALKNDLAPLQREVLDIELFLGNARIGADCPGKLRVYNAGVQDIVQAYERRSPYLPAPIAAMGDIGAAWSALWIFSEPVRSDDLNERLGRIAEERGALPVTWTDGRIPATLRCDSRGTLLRQQREHSREGQAAARSVPLLPRQYIDDLKPIAGPGGRNLVRVLSGLQVGHATASDLEAGLSDPWVSGAAVVGGLIYNRYVVAAGRPDWDTKLNFSAVVPANAIVLPSTFDLSRKPAGYPGPMLTLLDGHYKTLPNHFVFLGWLTSRATPDGPVPIALGLYTAAGDASPDNQIVAVMGVHHLVALLELQGRESYGEHVSDPDALAARQQAQATRELCGPNRPFKSITYTPVRGDARAQRLDSMVCRVVAVPRYGTAQTHFIILNREGKGGIVAPPAQAA